MRAFLWGVIPPKNQRGSKTGNRVASPIDLDNLPPMRHATTFIEAREAAKAFQGKPLINTKTGMVAVVSRKSLDKMLSESAVAKSESPAIQSTAVANADRLFENAVYGWSKPDRAGTPDLKAIHRFFASMQVGGRMKMVKLTVKEMVRAERNNSVYTLEAVDFEDGGNGGQWLANAALEDGVSIGEKIPQRGEREGEIAESEDSDPRASRIGLPPQGSAAGDVRTLARAIAERNATKPAFSCASPTDTVREGETPSKSGAFRPAYLYLTTMLIAARTLPPFNSPDVRMMRAFRGTS